MTQSLESVPGAPVGGAPVSGAPLAFSCSACGYATHVPSSCAGKAIRCPHCSAPQIAGGDASATTDSLTDGKLRFACACGYRGDLSAEWADRVIYCPGCRGVRVVTPRRAPPVALPVARPLAPVGQPAPTLVIPPPAAAPLAAAAADSAPTESTAAKPAEAGPLALHDDEDTVVFEEPTDRVVYSEVGERPTARVGVRRVALPATARAAAPATTPAPSRPAPSAPIAPIAPLARVAQTARPLVSAPVPAPSARVAPPTARIAPGADEDTRPTRRALPRREAPPQDEAPAAAPLPEPLTLPIGARTVTGAAVMLCRALLRLAVAQFARLRSRARTLRSLRDALARERAARARTDHSRATDRVAWARAESRCRQLERQLAAALAPRLVVPGLVPVPFIEGAGTLDGPTGPGVSEAAPWLLVRSSTAVAETTAISAAQPVVEPPALAAIASPADTAAPAAIASVTGGEATTMAPPISEPASAAIPAEAPTAPVAPAAATADAPFETLVAAVAASVVAATVGPMPAETALEAPHPPEARSSVSGRNRPAASGSPRRKGSPKRRRKG